MKKIKIIGDALLWMEPKQQGEKRGKHRGEFKGWIGDVPDDVADKAIAGRQAVEATPEMEATPTIEQREAQTFDPATVHESSIANIMAYLNQLGTNEKAAEALRISELELAKPKPRQHLILSLDKIVEAVTA